MKYFLDSPFKQQPPTITTTEYEELFKYPHHFGIEALEKDIDLLIINNDIVNKHFIISALVSGIRVRVCEGVKVCGFLTGERETGDYWFKPKYLDPRIKKLDVIKQS